MHSRAVIVGVDPSRPEHQDAIAFAALLARAAGVPLLLASVYEPRRESSHQARPYEHALDAAIAGFGESLGGLEVERLAAPGVSAAGVLHVLADQRDAIAVVVGSSPRANWGQVALGEVGQRLMHGGRSAVVVVPRGYAGRAADASRAGELGAVGVGYAGTPESDDALRAGAAIAAEAGLPLQVITAFEPGDYAQAMATEADGDLREHARHRLAEAVGAIQVDAASTINEDAAGTMQGEAVSGRLIDGDPADTLTRESEELGLLVLGSRSYGPLRAVLLGKVSGQLLLHAACPVMVVPHAPDREHEVTLPGGVEARAEP